uniref:Uncharacterized protein n=1 Tax=Chromera velia CCMP2878 TaxID=1169474 RepID=A0A0G4I7Q3_9ALVE|eukprot:Cvel_36561.t1-p1 / transcript=Cvel_36561.t1 / gene=Cvel_36561 / organism=Chromera_velia_CCMP2878 / gene_product=hypothetical protein / transcript_product=hypothetical protein / location=Cvel_scaffold7442:727-1197(-) / protein_length=157 / sequence_SO=supercontig / SO=protein_coding / is_pseudo=false
MQSLQPIALIFFCLHVTFTAASDDLLKGKVCIYEAGSCPTGSSYEQVCVTYTSGRCMKVKTIPSGFRTAHDDVLKAVMPDTPATKFIDAGKQVCISSYNVEDCNAERYASACYDKNDCRDLGLAGGFMFVEEEASGSALVPALLVVVVTVLANFAIR